jgi:hypothetical protein
MTGIDFLMKNIDWLQDYACSDPMIWEERSDISNYVTKMVGFVSSHYYEIFRYWITNYHLHGVWIDGACYYWQRV